MHRWVLASLIAVAAAVVTVVSYAGVDAAATGRIAAFPGAQGWGRHARGARAATRPTVYHVTNLNDTGTGSLRDAVSQGGRIVVFDVSGVIRIKSRIVFASNLYVAGQTAPGEGITVYGDGVSFTGASNIVCRYLRVRMGHNGTSGKDCAGIAHGTNMIFDHCSFSWGQDETFSINPDGKGDLHSITLSNCIFGQGLMTHSAGGLMQADSITLYRNLYIDNSTRNNKVKGINQYANNVVYNWSNGAYIMGGDSEGSSYVNIESNLFINGPSTGASAGGFTGANAQFHCYGVDNWQDNDKDGIYDPKEMTNYSASDRRTTNPYPYPELELYAGNELIEKNIPTVGASLPYRDQSDCYMIDELMSMGKSGSLISNEETLPIGAPDTWTWYAGQKPADTDGDGMPDAWEDAHGLNKNSAADAVTVAANGYLNIENYINSITEANRNYFLRRPITLGATATTTTLTVTWRDYTYGEDGFIVEYREDGASEYVEAGRTAADATGMTIGGLADGTAYEVRVCAFGTHDGTVRTSEYATGTYKTRPVERGMVDIDSYVPDVTNSTDVATGQRLLLHTDETLHYALDAAISPASVVVTGAGQVTVDGAAIGDTASVNKGGTGTLTLNYAANAYTGATALHDGVLEFVSIADGGSPSAIGASQEFAQNWVMDGGTYRYVGTSDATTNRSARLMRPTTLEIANGKTVTLNGTIEGEGDSQNMTFGGNGQFTVGTTRLFGYTGTTTLAGGTLYLSTTDIAKNGIGSSSRLVMAGGKLTTRGETSNYETYKFPIEVVENTVSIFAPYRNCYMNNVLTGAGTLQVDIPYLREYFNFDTKGFSGRIVANGVSTDSWGALMLKESSYNIPTTVVTLRGNAKLCVWATVGDSYIGGLSGSAGTCLMGSSKSTDGTTCTWTIGSAGSDEQFDGEINNSCCAKGHYNKAVNINKVGTGLWRLTGKNIYQGATDVREGTLIVDGTQTGNSGYAGAVTPTYTVRSGATLKGTGAIQKGTITIMDGGTIIAGDSVVDGSALTLTGTTLNLKSGASLSVPLFWQSGSKNNNAFALGTLKIEDGATLGIDMSRVYGALPVDTKFRIFQSMGDIDGTFTTIEPATPGEGLQWDLSELYTNGIIYVREEGAEQFVWIDRNVMQSTGRVDDDGYYRFTADNDAATQSMVESGVITFDAAGKAALATTYETDKQTGAIKLSKGAQLVFALPGDCTSLSLALYRASGTDWGQVYGSYDGQSWTLIQNITNDKFSSLASKMTSYVDLTIDGMKNAEYRYIKVEQANGNSPTYLAGVRITSLYKQSATNVASPRVDVSHTGGGIRYDLSGHRKTDTQGIMVTRDKKIIYTTNR